MDRRGAAEDVGSRAPHQLPEGSTSLELLARAIRGDANALSTLFDRLLPPLRWWAHGRLPRWARGAFDTADLVQEAFLHTLRRLPHFEPRRRKALRSYLRQAIRNRITDELRRVGRSPHPEALDPELVDAGPSPLELAAESETVQRYKRGLARLRVDERDVIVARLELGYSYAQIALAASKPTPESARKAVQRALLRLAEEMDHA